MNADPSKAAAMGRTIIYVTPGGEQCPGMITRVNGDGTINLVAFNDAHGNHGHLGTSFHTGVQFDETGTKEKSWLWPLGMKYEGLCAPEAHTAGNGDIAGNIDAPGDGGSTRNVGSGVATVEAKPATSAEPVTAAAGASPLGAIGNLQIPEGTTLKL